MRPATAVASTADWVVVCRGHDIPRGAKQRLFFEGRPLLISRTRTGKVTVEDVAEPEKTHPTEILQSKMYNYSKHCPAANRSGEPLRSWPAREVEGNIKIFVGRGKENHVGEGEMDPDEAERRGLYQHVGRGNGSDGHDISPREIERFLNVALSSGVSRFHVPEEALTHLSASNHLHSRSKKRFPNHMMEIQSADIDSSASRTNNETMLEPSLPSYVKFLVGPTAAPHWHVTRAVTPDLENPRNPADAGNSMSTNYDYTKKSRGFSASRSASSESRKSRMRPHSALNIFEDEGQSRTTEIKKEEGARKHALSAHNGGLRLRAAANASRTSSNGSNARGSGGAGISDDTVPAVRREHTSEQPKGVIRKTLRPITAAADSPQRRAEAKKQAWDKHLKRLRPVTAVKKVDHLQEYYATLPKNIEPLMTDPESLVELRDSVTNFQAKFRQSILSGLILQYQKRVDKKSKLIEKWTGETQNMQLELKELQEKEKEKNHKVKEVDSEIDKLQEQVWTLEDKVFAVEKLIEDRGPKGKSEMLQKELSEERSKMNTIKGKMREVQATRQKLHLQHQKAADKLRENELVHRKLKDKIEVKMEEEARLRTVLTIASKFVDEGGYVEMDENFPTDLAGAIQSIQANVNVPEEQDGSNSSPNKRDAEFDNGDRLASIGEEQEEEAGKHQKEEEDFRTSPSVWIRRRELAMRATSPRWRQSILDETHRWEQIMPAPEKKKRILDDDEEPDALASPNKKIKSPCTKTYKETFSIAADNWEKSFYQKMKAHCMEDWKQDFSDRLLQPNQRDHRTNWFYEGLPCDRNADEARLREIRKDRQFPSPEEDLVNFRKAMAGKWKNMDKLFKDIDKSGDGLIDVHEFSSCCKRLKLGWSEFQVHRVFRNAAGEDMQLDFVEFYNAFAPLRATSEVKMLFHNKIPFLILEPEGAVEEVVSALIRVVPPPKAGDFIYKVACDVHEHMYFILEGQVRLTEASGSEIKVVGDGQCFGEMAVVHSDLGKHGLLRRDSAQTITDCTLFMLKKSDLELMYPKYPNMRKKLFNLSAIVECNTRAEARGLCPKYPDCRIDGATYTSQLGQTRVMVEPKVFVPIKLREHEHLRTNIFDKSMGWPALQLETSVNEHVPDASGAWPEESTVERTIRLCPIIEKGIEVKKTFDYMPTPAERMAKIETCYSNKFFRLKNLRKEGLSYIEKIGKMR